MPRDDLSRRLEREHDRGARRGAAQRAGEPLSRRQSLLIALTLAALVVIAYLFGTQPGHAALLISAIVLAVLMIMQRRAAGRARAFHAANQQALAALASGDLDRARATWSTWADAPGSPRIAAMSAHNVAWTLLRQGKLDRAIATLEANEERRLSALQAIGLSATSAADRALAHALAGNLPEAERWIAKAEERLLHATMPTTGALALAHAALHCRAGRIPAATKLLADGWAQIEATTTGDVLRPLRVIRAFALAAAGPRSAGLAEAELASVRPAYPEEYAFLGADWPAMQQFLAAHDLAG